MRDHQLSTDQINDLMDNAEVGHLATIDPDGYPYVVPVHFARVGDKIFVHGLKAGRKLDNLGRDPKICFEIMGGFKYVHGPSACETNTSYQSVVIRGLASVIDEEDAALKALDAIVAKYAPQHVGAGYTEQGLGITAVIVIETVSVTGKYY
jgi:nitroimidazol reductase NimA-like FMN-containing flavoprotein (pyridoxamine 5'-phosphate oxidase superfamily)